jgi:hypothetical protein
VVQKPVLSKKIVLVFLDKTGRRLTDANLYFLSNDLNMNDILSDELKRGRKQGVNKVRLDGTFAIDVHYLNKLYNRSGMDSVSGLFHCGEGYGQWFRFSVKSDTAIIRGLEPCKH